MKHNFTIKDAEREINELRADALFLKDLAHNKDLEIDYLKEAVESENEACAALLCMGRKILAQYNKILKQ